MRQLLGALVIVAMLVVACGGEAPAGSDGGGGGGTSDPGGGAGGGADLPAGSAVIFGSAFDPASLTVSGKVTRAKAGSPIVAVGRAFSPRPPAEIVVQVSSGSNQKPARPVTAANSPDNADLFAFDLSGDGLTPGTWVVSFLNPSGKIVASGFLTVTP